MTLAGYILLPGSHFGAMWRHPYSETDYCDRTLYERTARALERASFDLAFIPESLSLPAGPGGDFRDLTRFGAVGTVRHDPAQLAAAMTSVTRTLGVTVTLSTTFMEPYHLARTLGTLDHFSGGRIAWNVVTSAGASNRENFAHQPALRHDELYERAEEVLEVCRALWTSWDADALVVDKDRGIFADTAKVHPLDHAGRYFSVKGPLSLPRGPGAGPVLMMAGVSPRGRDFAARWAEVVFAIQSDPADAGELRRDIRARAERFGRDPQDIRLLMAVQPVIGETRAIASARAAFLDDLILPDMARAFFGAMLNLDLAGTPPDTLVRQVLAGGEARPAVDAGAMTPWLRQLLDAEPELTLDAASRALAASSTTPRLVGTGRDIADQLEAMFADACDGFVITPTHFPGTFEEFGRAVVPELRARGMLRECGQGEPRSP